MHSNREKIVAGSKTKTITKSDKTVKTVKTLPRRTTETAKNETEPSPRGLKSKKDAAAAPPATTKQTTKATEATRITSDRNKLSVKQTTPVVQKSTPTIMKKETNAAKPKRLTLQAKSSSNAGPTKSQFFPSKTNFAKTASIAKEATVPKKVPSHMTIPIENKDKEKDKDRERNRTRTLSPSEVKFAKQMHADEESPVERPRTATLRSNVAKEEAANLPNADKNDDDYEDDFESYESDFEEYQSSASDSTAPDLDINTDDVSSSSESLSRPEITTTSLEKRLSSAEERKLDSGNFDLPDNKHTQILHQINENGHTEHSNLTSLSDEGFDEGLKYKINTNAEHQLRVLTLDNPKRKLKTGKENLLQRKKRGEEILSMIRLDACNFSIFEMEPVPYEIFMKFYGGINRSQTSSQTGEDNANISIQTDEMHCTETWCQFPARITDKDIINMEHYRQEMIGTGCKLKDESEKPVRLDGGKVDYVRLNRFLNSVEPIVTSVIKMNNPANIENLDKSNVPFSDGFIELNTKDKEFLSNRRVTNIVFSSSCSWLLLTSHKSNTQPYMDEQEELFSRPLICLWNIFDTTNPEKLLICSSDVSTCDIINGNCNLVFAGLVDGALVTWDLDENAEHHREIFDKKLKRNFLLRTPTYSTATLQNAHSTCIVSTQLVKDSMESLDTNSIHLNTLVCTLDDNGKIIIWTVIKRENSAEMFVRDQGLAHWGKVILAQHTVLSVWEVYPDLKSVQFTAMEINKIDPNHFFIGTNTDSVVHFHRSGRKYHPKLYTSKLDKDVQINRIECCPFSDQYFLVACNDGTVRLHSRTVSKALMTLVNTAVGDNFRIELLQWSTSKACVFYTFDSSNTLHVWDLASSDMYPMYSIPMKEKITGFRLSPVSRHVKECYMVIAMQNGSVYLHVLNKDYGIQSSEQNEKDISTFINYVNRL